MKWREKEKLASAYNMHLKISHALFLFSGVYDSLTTSMVVFFLMLLDLSHQDLFNDVAYVLIKALVSLTSHSLFLHFPFCFCFLVYLEKHTVFTSFNYFIGNFLSRPFFLPFLFLLPSSFRLQLKRISLFFISLFKLA
jgi:hypothetical protein